MAISAIKMMQRNLAAQPRACASRVSVAAELAATSAADNPGPGTANSEQAAGGGTRGTQQETYDYHGYQERRDAQLRRQGQLRIANLAV